ncbi:MAG: hypothetical protein K8R77_01880 [Anaerolineaceae bacterium]|nr:hypothetical protein [Anaerolineaceae bacterium]
MSYNKVILKGMLYLINSDKIKKLSDKPFIDCKLVTGAGSAILLERHDVLLVGFQAVKALAFIRANEDRPVKIWCEGKLVSRNGISIVKIHNADYFISDDIQHKAEKLIHRLQQGDSFLEASFEETALMHSQQLRTFKHSEVFF